MKKYLLLPLAALCLSACGVQSIYIGKSYPATASAESFFDWADVPYAYETMGHIEAYPRLKTLEDAQAAIEQTGREKGADAIVFDGINREVFDPTFTATETTQRNEEGAKIRTATMTRSATVVNSLTATFIKYKK